jgi:hypothetical protein
MDVSVSLSHLGDVMVSVLPIRPKVLGLKPRVFKSNEIRSSPSSGDEVKAEAPCHKILRHVKILSKYEQRYFVRLNSDLLRPFLLLATR